MRPNRRSADEGVSLVEIMVTMGIMSVVMMVFTGSIMQVYRTVNSTESLSTAQAYLQNAFKRLDKELRYATWIGAPSASAAPVVYTVEFAVPPDPALPATDPHYNVVRCRQLRLDNNGVLQLLQWYVGSTAPTSSTKGQSLASNLVANDLDPNAAVARNPFVLQLAGSKPYATTTPDPSAVGTSYTSDYYRLRIRLTTKVYDRYIRSDITVTALNTSYKTLTENTNLCEV